MEPNWLKIYSTGLNSQHIGHTSPRMTTFYMEEIPFSRAPAASSKNDSSVVVLENTEMTLDVNSWRNGAAYRNRTDT
jgi:hypothetical protein